MKKILTALITATLLFSPIGNVIFQDHTITVEAKSYKSGKKGFNFNSNTNKSNTNNNNSLFQNNKNNSSKSTATTNKSGGFMSGGLMKGLMLGGLAGLLFGGLLGNLGMLGSLLGLAVNILAIVILFAIVRKIFTFFTKKKDEERNPWRS
ncbi:hypothetical protein [Oceanobacillus polygoni]|uniref:Lipid-binding transport protein (Tim44 family) n=1 Tax=Oceanobacillus polygoni TaxID=1235259 RepID=A0A9X1CIH1_9BACI|nr:hypothetical protein [Oceanobacillus polygoni]MBP2078478.1 putative lipid-binding transport protein (Tim44 family) [Oceanobacillus polygoni]